MTVSTQRLETAARAIARFDTLLSLPGYTDLWRAFALPDEAAAIVRRAGYRTSRPRLRLLMAGANAEAPSRGDRQGVLVLQRINDLLDGPDDLETRINAFLADFVHKAERSDVLTPFQGWRVNEAVLVAVARTVAALHDRGSGTAALAPALAAGLLEQREAGTRPPVFLLAAAAEQHPALWCPEDPNWPDAFLQLVEVAADRHLMTLARIVRSRQTARGRLSSYIDTASHRRRGLRQDSLLPAAGDTLIDREVVTTPVLRDELERRGHPIAVRTAQRLIEQLVDAGVAKEATGRRHFRVWVPTDLPIAELRRDEAAPFTEEQHDGDSVSSSDAAPLAAAASFTEPRSNLKTDVETLLRTGDQLVADSRNLLDKAFRSLGRGYDGADDC